MLRSLLNKALTVNGKEIEIENSIEKKRIFHNFFFFLVFRHSVRSRAITRYDLSRSYNTSTPATHSRTFGQPTYMTHPNILKKGEGKKELFVRCSENLCFLKQIKSDTRVFSN
jgi:hypothetical protein